MPGFYLADFSQNELSGDEYHHIVNVFRHKVGDTISLTNGLGLTSKAVIKDISKQKVSLEIAPAVQHSRSPYKLSVAFSLLRHKNDYFIIEKLTELGAYELFPFVSRYSVKQSKDTTSQKFLKVAISAIKQCDTPFMPKIYEPYPLHRTLQNVQELGYQPLLAAECHAEETLKNVATKDNNYCLFIGSEGGFAPEEFQLFATLKIPFFTLGTNILRAETAAIASFAILRNLF